MAKRKSWEPELSSSDITRFWSKVKRMPGKECWTWLGALDHGGYGHFTVGGWMFGAHRISFQITHGRMANGVVRHACDNPPCVRPSHLVEGTPAQNAADIKERNRRSPELRAHKITDLVTEVIALKHEVRLERKRSEEVEKLLRKMADRLGYIFMPDDSAKNRSTQEPK